MRKIVGTAVRGVVLVVVGFALFDVPAPRGLRCWQPYGHSDVSTTGARIELSAHIALGEERGQARGAGAGTTRTTCPAAPQK
jgi:hypothetical protein